MALIGNLKPLLKTSGGHYNEPVPHLTFFSKAEIRFS